MKKRMISIALALVMMFAMCMTVSASKWESDIDACVAEVNGVYYSTVQEAVNAATGTDVVKVLQTTNETVTNDKEPLYLDLNGCDVTVNGGSVHLVDSATNDGAVGGVLSGTSNNYATVTASGKIQYLVIGGNGENRTANAVRVKLTQVSIRTSADGIYYTTRFAFNENVAKFGVTYGVVLSLKGTPGADFADEKVNGQLVNLWTKKEIKKGTNKALDETGRSCLVRDILKEELLASENSQRGSTSIFANAYVKVNGQTFLAENSNPVIYSMRTVMEGFDTNLQKSLTSTEALSGLAQGVYDFYTKWAENAMSDWTLPNLCSYENRTYDLQSDVLYMGRTYEDDNAQWFNWSASGFSVKFQGSGIKATIASNAPDAKNYAYLKVYVDGVEQEDILLNKTSQTVTLASGLDASATHTVEVRKRNSPRSSTAGLVHLALTDGEKLAKPAQKNMLIEFVGDSLTVGYSAADVNKTETVWSTKTEDGTKTYSKQVADAFGAEYMVTAISGRGVVMNNGGGSGYLFPEIYPELDIYNVPDTTYNFSLQPDVIVINLGTNDATNSGLDLNTFKTGAVNFIKLVRAKNPNAQIIWAFGLRRTDKKFEDVKAKIQEAVTQVYNDGDNKVHYLELPAAAEMHITHPTAASYAPSGNAIIAKIQEITGKTPIA